MQTTIKLLGTVKPQGIATLPEIPLPQVFSNTSQYSTILLFFPPTFMEGIHGIMIMGHSGKFYVIKSCIFSKLLRK